MLGKEYRLWYLEYRVSGPILELEVFKFIEQPVSLCLTKTSVKNKKFIGKPVFKIYLGQIDIDYDGNMSLMFCRFDDLLVLKAFMT